LAAKTQPAPLSLNDKTRPKIAVNMAIKPKSSGPRIFVYKGSRAIPIKTLNRLGSVKYRKFFLFN